MSTIPKLVESIDTRLRSVGEEIKTLETARLALEGTSSRRSPRAAPAVTPRPASVSAASSGTRASAKSDREASLAAARARVARPRKDLRKTRRASTRRALKAVTPDQIESLLSGNGGLTTTALAEQTNTDREQILVLLRELEAAGRIRRTGQRRSTRWHAITDEDRIRERAAELEATRKHAT
jgi:DNA-binding MarR family transcriptional regulator